MSSAGMEWVRVLLIVDLLRLDDEVPRRAGEGGVKDAKRRQRRAAGEPVF
jgi:hypothetical protein